MEESKHSLDFDVTEFFKIILDNYKTIIAISLLFTTLASLFSYTLVPKFQSTITVVSTQTTSDTSGLSSLASEITGISAQKGPNDTEIALLLLRTKGFLSSFVKKNGYLEILYPQKTNNPSDAKIFRDFADKFEISRGKGTIRIKFMDKDPQVASNMANSIVEEINFVMRQEAKDYAQKNLNYLIEESGKTKLTNLKKRLDFMYGEQVEKAMIAEVQKDYVFKVIEKAYPAEKRYYPIRTQIAGIGFSFGFILSIFSILLRKVFWDKN